MCCNGLEGIQDFPLHFWIGLVILKRQLKKLYIIILMSKFKKDYTKNY